MPIEAQRFGSSGRSPVHGTTHARTNKERGYDSSWSHGVRPYYIKQHPVCERCKSKPSSQVHHVVKFRGLKDPRRLDFDNLTALCVKCHQAVHGSIEGRYGMTLQMIHWQSRMEAVAALIARRYP